MKRTLPLLLIQGCVLISDEEYSWRTDGADSNEPCTEQTWWADEDSDGYGDPTGAVQSCEQPAATADNYDDCDDTDASVGPTGTWYLDADRDGYGSTVSTAACAAPEGYVADDTDCDDDDPAVNPGATEDCATGADDDCDGDDNTIDALNCTSWFHDGDGDGYGTGDPLCACSARDGYDADAGGDCDDTDDAVSPDAEEVCYDGVDNDCDGTAGSCGLSGDVELQDADLALLGMADGDLTGNMLASIGDTDGDGKPEVAVGAQAGDQSFFQGGQVYLVEDPTTGDLDLETGSMATIRGGAVGDRLGIGLAAGGDLDGDGLHDVLLGAPYDGASNAGAAWLAFGPLSGGFDVAEVGPKFSGTNDSDYAGWAVAGAGDFDGDGNDDALVAAYRAAGAAATTGAVYVLSGPLESDLSLGSAGTIFQGVATGDRVGYSIAGGQDVDGDGFDDVVIGADRADDGGSDAGVAYVVFGPRDGTLALSSADATWLGVESNETAGFAVLLAGDVDGDGSPDLVVGAPGKSGTYTGVGSAYLVTDVGSGAQSLSTADARLIGEASMDEAGAALSAADFTGDGHPDLLVGAPGADGGGASAGLVYLVTSAPSGTVSLSSSAARLVGLEAGDLAGTAVAGVADLNGDGADEILVGATVADGSASNAGAAYLLYGGGL